MNVLKTKKNQAAAAAEEEEEKQKVLAELKLCSPFVAVLVDVF